MFNYDFWKKHPKQEYALLHDLYVRWSEKKPLTGLRVLNNTPLTLETLMKVDCLIAGGAEVTLTRTKFIRPDESLVTPFLTKMPVRYIAEHADLKPLADEFDFVLDCGAELIDIVHPKQGLIELTGSGTSLLKANHHTLPYPAVSIDDSKIKTLETFFGTAEGFVRALQELFEVNLNDIKVVLFGYGKVGRGIIYGLNPFTNNITIVDNTADTLNRAVAKNLNAIHSAEQDSLYKAVNNADLIVTACGHTNLISELIPTELLNNKLLANMSAEDDFGDAIANEKVLGNKLPINFLLASPTLMRYLDPSFCAHNEAIELILQRKLAPGFHALPKEYDEKLLHQWQTVYKEPIQVIWD